MTQGVAVTLEEVPALAGRQLGHTEWREMTQDWVDRFADVTEDHNYIHVDVERAKASPFGGTIAHGYLTVSLLAPISLQSAPKSVLRGERVSLAISAPDRRRITLYQRAKGSAWRASQHDVRDGIAKVRLAPMDADLALFATDGRTVSDTA